MDDRPPLDVALELAGHGWHVHPLCWPNDAGECHPACPGQWDKPNKTFRRHIGRDVGKAPLTRHGWKDATNDPDEIRALWATWPGANVGIALKPSGLVAIDPDSEEAQAETVARGRPATTVRVSRNNAFVYTRPGGCPTELALKKGRSGKLDVLSLGYLVAFGTHQTGVPVYVEWLGGPPPAPSWAVQILFEQQREREAKQAQEHVRPAGQQVGLEDSELLKHMFAAKNGAEIRKLWYGDWEADPRWPSWSEADLALCNHLAWWTRRDAARMDRMFRSSGLMREKWGGSYARCTLDEAIAATPYGFGEDDPLAPRIILRRRRPGRSLVPATGALNATNAHPPSIDLAPTVWVPVDPERDSAL